MMLGLMVGVIGGCGEDIKVWVVKHSNGQVKEEYQYYHHPDNNKRMKEGWYNSYYKNGNYKEVGTYKENKRDGEWIYHSEDGKETKRIWKDGVKWSGEFWINVKHDSLGIFVETEDELWEGDEDNSKNVFRGLFTYDDGMWNGLGVLYWKNGNKRGEGLYEDGKLEGKSVGYYESGEVKLEKTYWDGKIEGKLVKYDEEGNITDEDIYSDGECVSMCEGGFIE